MKRVKVAPVAITAVLSVIAWSYVGFAQGTNGKSDPEIGSWKLNIAKSKYDPGPSPRSQTNALEPSGKSGVKLTADGVAADGNRIAYSWSANYDGKDYPYNPGSMGAPNGADTVSLKRIDPYTIDIVQKKGGKVVQTTRAVYSKDGKTRILTSKGTNQSGQPTSNVTVWDKQ
jgi:hypothetical protein